VYLVQAHKEPLSRAALPAAEVLDGGWEYALLGAATPGLDALVERHEAVARAEQVRLLYVALTRAADRLVVVGSWPRPLRETDPDGARQHAQLLPSRAGGVPDLDALFADCAAGRAAPERDAHGARWVALGLRPLPERTPLQLDLLPVESSAAAESDALAQARRAAALRAQRPRSAAPSAQAVPLALRGARAAAPEVAREVGRALHRLLETFDPSAEPAGELARQRAQLADLLGGGHGQARSAARAAALLEAFHAGPLAARLRALAPHVAARELPILAPPDGATDGPTGYSAGVIDLVYRDPETGEWVVADYKTDAVRTPAEVSERACHHAPQALAYAQAVRSALGLERLPRAELWFLQAGLIELAKPLG
jgi:ATP-dependent exoDNAse (exonuclease V) beta subunit